jgi:hypothetical protein
VLASSARPGSSRLWRTSRLVIAIIGCYICINLTVYFDHTQLANEVNNNPHATHEDFMRLSAASGASDVFMLVFGWVWAIMYVGRCELAWRRYHRAKMISLRKGCGDDGVANMVVTLSYYLTLLFLVLIIVAITGTCYEIYFKG